MQQSVAVVEIRADTAAGDLLSDVVAEDRTDYGYDGEPIYGSLRRAR